MRHVPRPIEYATRREWTQNGTLGRSENGGKKMRRIRFRRLAATSVVVALVVGLSAQMGADAAVRRQTNTA